MDFTVIESRLHSLKGKVGFYYEDLASGESFGVNDNEGYIAASVIKIPVLVEAYRQFEQKVVSQDDFLEIRDEDRVPSCGAAAYLHAGTRLTLKDLCRLMIIISDNMATNLLIKKLGMEDINRTIADLGLKKTRLKRLLFDSNAESKGKQNYITPREIALLLKLMREGKLVSSEASAEMLEILKHQEINHKIPSMLPDDVCVAHKTGEDDGITHDAGIVYAARPFILCFASNNTDVPQTEQFIRTSARMIYDGR